VRGSGVNQTKAALYIYDGHIPFRTAIGKFICSSLAIGAGHSLGPEDPSLQIGAALASAMGRRLRLSRDKARLVAPIGAAAGLAAAFNAPISAILFVIEEVIGRWSAGIFGAVVLAAVSGVVVTRFFLGSQPFFYVPNVASPRAGELLAYAALGVIGAFASAVFSRAIGGLRARLKALPRWTLYLQPAIAGLIIGAIGYSGLPQIMGDGYQDMSRAMLGQYGWRMLGILAGLKILTTTLSFATGTPGGMFAPSLFIGAMLGGAVGGVQHILLPHSTGPIATYALVGMGVLFAGFLRAPMTSVFMVLELSGDYSIIVPVIVANTLSYLISRALVPVPIFDVLTRQDGLILPSMEEEREQRILRVEDAMKPPDLPVVAPQLTVAAALGRLQAEGKEMLLLDERPRGWVAFTGKQLEALVAKGNAEAELRQFSLDAFPSLHPDQTLDHALRLLQNRPFLPVTHRAPPGAVVGVISLSDVLTAYQKCVPAS
jgi:CIC family chloride channel protein